MAAIVAKVTASMSKPSVLVLEFYTSLGWTIPKRNFFWLDRIAIIES
jgi:hypothetical protein